MPLIKCEDCQKDVSTKATACPNCGCPVKASTTHSYKAKSKNKGSLWTNGVLTKNAHLAGKTIKRDDGCTTVYHKNGREHVQLWHDKEGLMFSGDSYSPDGKKSKKFVRNGCGEIEYFKENGDTDYIVQYDGGEIYRDADSPTLYNDDYSSDSSSNSLSPKLLWFIGISVVCFFIITIILKEHNNTMRELGGEELGIGFGFFVAIIIGGISSAFIPSGNGSDSYSSADQYRAISAVQREQQRRELSEINEELDDISDHFEQ